jgi:hypothetical protein
MRVLVGAEFSTIVRDAFIALGHDAVSCDLIESERPGPHIVGDVLNVLDDGWDLALFFPPCTYLCASGIHWNRRRPERAALTEEAVEFVKKLLDAPIPKIALENPVGILSSRVRKPDQIIQPWEFGEDASKATCLWLKGLPKLEPTCYVSPTWVCRTCKYEVPSRETMRGYCSQCKTGKLRPVWSNQTPSGQNKLGPSPTRATDRARTYSGIAEAMATQWSV